MSDQEEKLCERTFSPGGAVACFHDVTGGGGSACEEPCRALEAYSWHGTGDKRKNNK